MITADPTLLVALAVVVKATALLGIAAIMQLVVFRRASAATRHLVWTIALVSVLLLPVVSLVGPAWTVEIPAAQRPVSVTPVATSADAPLEIANGPASPVIALESTPAPPRAANVSWSAAFIIVYCAGAIGLLMYLLAQQWNVRRFARQATLVQDAAWTRLLDECADALGIRRPVRLLRSRTHGVPLAFGTRRPSIVIPDIADQWTDDRRRAVLLHELAHVARRDCLTQSVAFGACALYWFHPALWWVAGRLRVERELACDDRVIAAGSPRATMPVICWRSRIRLADGPRRRSRSPWRVLGSSKGGCWPRSTIGAIAPFPQFGSALSSRRLRWRSSCRWRP